jgi:uncharacterized protein YndB with AHSA1/START domain
MKEMLTTVDGRPVLHIERRLPHPPQKVWGAITEPEQLSRWYPFRAGALDLRIGGRIRFDDGHGKPVDALVTELEPVRLFAFSTHAPPEISRESEDLVRFELRPHGAGCLLAFTHIFDDRYGAAGYASGWHVCLDALEAMVGGRPVEPAYPAAGMHDAFVEKFGLDRGTVSETADGWMVRFERQLTRPAETAWALLSSEGDGPAAGPEVGGTVPQAFTTEKIRPGVVTSVKPPDLVEYEWRSGSHTGGRVRWELSRGTGHGARLVLTQTGTRGVATERHTALKAWKTRIAHLAEQLRDLPPG